MILMMVFHTVQLLRTPFFVQQAIFAPLSFGLLLALGSLGSGMAPGGDLWFFAAVAGLWATTTTAVGLIGFQRFQGTLELLAASVRSPVAVFGSLCAAASMIGLLGLPLGILLSLLLTGAISITWLQCLGYLLALLGCVVSAFLLASLFVLARSATVYEPLILSPIWLLTGIIVPFAEFPSALKPVAMLLPLTSAVSVARSVSPTDAAPWLTVFCVSLGLWLLLARTLMRLALRRARVLGTLGLA